MSGSVERLAGGSLAQDIAFNLGQGIAGGIAGQLGAMLVRSVFPQSVPTYFDQVYKEITKIVKQVVLENEIQSINGAINGTQLWVKEVYLGEKEHGRPRTELVNELGDEIQNLFRNVLGPLELPHYATAGFSVYMVAAGLLLALVQEQVLVAPAESPPGPAAYAENFGRMAQARFNFALDTFIKILQARVKSVKLRDSDDPDMVMPEFRLWFWTDSATGEKSAKKTADREKAVASMIDHIDKVCVELIQSLENPMSTAMNWLKPSLDYDALPLYRSSTTDSNEYFFDYSNTEDYAGRLGVQGWTGYGVFGWMGGQTTADVPVYRMVAKGSRNRVLIVFNPSSYEAHQTVGWEGRGLLGHLWSDPSKVPVGTPVPVYSLTAQGTGRARTLLVTSLEEYRDAQSRGWAPAGATPIVGYLCSQG